MKMSNENAKPQDNRSASQKITDLENAVMSLFQTVDNMARDIGTVKQAIKLLGNKVDSIVKASSAGEAITDTVISRIMVENNVEELASKVKELVVQGAIVPSEQVSANSFVVGSELNTEGATENPRLQFALQALGADLQAKFLGAKIGDILNLQEGKLQFKVAEIYEVQMPAAEAPAAEAPAPAADAPAAEAASVEQTA